MTRMERRRRRRRILRIKLATTAAVLALTTASIVALTGGAAETVPEQTPQPPALQAEPVLLVAEHDSTYQPVQMTAEPAQEPEPVEEEDENEKIEAALLEQGYLHEEIPLDFDLQCHLITVCEEYGVPQSVALGVIQAESSFTATASNGSCYGYMQINSINSEWLSEKIGVTDLTDPYQNIRSGVFILSDLYGKYGDWHKALICYNYGEGGAREHVFSIPCPSIFDTKEEIKERYNLKAVRPLADNTMRRIIRGVDKFTIKSGQPYIVPTGYGERKGQAPRVHDIEEPLPTVVGSSKHNLCKPVLAPFTATNTSNSVGAPAGDPVHTVTTAGNQMLVTPYLAECNHAGGGHVADVRGPYKTITAKHTGGIVAPSLIQYHTEQTENVRASGLGAPIPTVDASNRYGLTCANLVKYYSGVVGEKMEEPLPTVTAIDHNAVCAAHVVKFKGNEVGTRPTDALPTQTSAGVFALCDTLLCKAGPYENLYRWPLIRELLNRYCGYKLADDDLLLLSIGGTLYFIADIGLRMLSPRELYNAMGFPPDYIIDRDYMGNPYPKNEQVARCGNAVCPPMAAAVARANFPEYVAKVGDTITTMAALLDMVAV